MEVSDIMFKSTNADSVVVDEINILSGALYKYRHYLTNPKCWQKFIINNTENLTRDEVLKTILDHVYPLDLIPVFFTTNRHNTKSYFLARNCEAAINKLANDNFIIEHPYNKSSNANFKPFKITIILNFSNINEVKIDVQKNVQVILQRRMKFPEKCLDLDRFSQDPGLSEYCPLSQPKIMYFVLHIAKSLSLEEIILTNNDIKKCNPLHVLFGLKLRKVDLSNNQILSFDDLLILKHFKITELKLTGNPLCNCNEDQYRMKVQEICPDLECLDGVPLNRGDFPIPRRNYLCNAGGFDLVNQFLEHFFTIYDSKDRRLLGGLYSPEALFSLTSLFLPTQTTSNSANLKPYGLISRNLIKSADVTKTSDFIYKGRDDIVNMFSNNLPHTEHDPYSFTADLVYKTSNCAILTITGVFNEPARIFLEQERKLGFTRTFVLELLEGESKCMILNDQLHVYNAFSFQVRNCFKKPIAHTKTVIPREGQFKPDYENDCDDLVLTLVQISNLQDDWARKCLEECNYDLKSAIELFINLYKGDKFPRHAFIL